ncbi:MAG: OprO/OprP family phosphate-selective porin [Muribaculaceae bacterium]|nr:OprO/OprP family phosphate-selective porin [Muribaculaceae bacterium]
MKHTVIALMAACLSVNAMAADDAVDYKPKFHGAVRARWEMDTREGDQRFQVRNARLTMEGNAASWAHYFVQTDLSDCGTMKILDAYGQLDICKGLNFRAGQFRMPFGVETFRAPQNYIFANRSFMGKQVMNYRAVGARLAYTLPKTPLTLEFGAFNPATITRQSGWSNTVAVAGKASWALGAGFTISASYASIKPYAQRANLIDGALLWQNNNWLVAGEYMYKHYCNDRFDPAHSWMAFADWHKNVSWGGFNRWSVQGRWDGMTRHHELTEQPPEQAARNRITVGSTLTYAFKMMHVDIRLNYEKYLYHSDHTPAVGDSDRLVAEMVIRF